MRIQNLGSQADSELMVLCLALNFILTETSELLMRF